MESYRKRRVLSNELFIFTTILFSFAGKGGNIVSTCERGRNEYIH